jgi:hypothetical protein
MNILQVLTAISKHDDPGATFRRHLLELHETDNYMQAVELEPWYELLSEVETKGIRLGYKRGRAQLLKEINERFKEV